jgi:hypothetical protein
MLTREQHLFVAQLAGDYDPRDRRAISTFLFRFERRFGFRVTRKEAQNLLSQARRARVKKNVRKNPKRRRAGSR